MLVTLGERSQGRENLITPLRLVLAVTVAVWHAVVLAGPHGPEWGVAGLSPSYMAVNGFFVLSGFLIAHSAEHRSLAYYAASRILRLYPAMIALLACGTGLALFYHAVTPGAPAEPGSWVFPLKALAFMDASGTFPGLFAANAPRTEFALPLWTLRYEALAYLGLPLLCLFGALSRPRIVWGLWAGAALAAALAGLWDGAPGIVVQGTRLAAAFLLGSAIYAGRDRLRAGPLSLIAALAAAFLLYWTPAFEAGANLVLAWVLFAVAFARIPGLGAICRTPDWSYGVYIWHWPVFQIIEMLHPAATTTTMLTIGLPISWLFAAVSWSFVERPSLAAKGALAGLFGRIGALRRAPRTA